MLIDSNKHPESNIFFIGAKQFEILFALNQQECDIYWLYEEYNKHNTVKISFDYHLLSLNWLFILNLIALNPRGNISLCI